MTKRLTPRRDVNHGPLHDAEPATAARHYGIPVHDLARLVDGFGFARDGERIAFGGRTLADLATLYLDGLKPPEDAEGFRILRRDWKLLQLPTDTCDERVTVNVKRHLKQLGRPADMERLEALLPFDREALRETARRLMLEGQTERRQERLEQLSEGKKAKALRAFTYRDPDTDPRLDRRVADALDCGFGHLDALYELGLIEPDPDAPKDGRRYARDPHLLDRNEIRRRLRDEPPRLTASNIRHYRMARTGFELGSLDDHAKSAFEDALAGVADQEICPSPSVMASILGGDPHQFVAPLLDYARRTGKRVKWSRRWATKAHQATLRDLADAIHPDAPVSMTAVDWDAGSPGRPPDGVIVQKVFSLEDPDDRTRAGIIALEGARMGVEFQKLSNAMSALNVFLPLMRGLDPSLPHHADSVLGPYAFVTSDDQPLRRRRLEHVLFYKYALEISDSWWGRLPPEQRADAARFRLAWPSGGGTIFTQVTSSFTKICSKGENDRDDRLAPWMDDPDRTMAFIMQKTERTLAFHDEVEACIAYLDAKLEAGSWDGVGPIHWFHEENFNDLAADAMRIGQRILFSVETWESKCRRLRATGPAWPDPHKTFQKWLAIPQRNLANNAYDGRPDPTINENRYVIAVHTIVPLKPGDPVSPPRWLRLFEGCVLSPATRLSAELAEGRAIAVKETGVHSLSLAMPCGLLDYAGLTKKTLARKIREKLGEVCIPVHELAHGTALAAFSASARYDLPARTSELAQTDLDEDKWESWTDPITGEGYAIFQQVRKMSDTEEDFIFSPYTISLLTRVAGMASLRFFSGGEWPSIEPGIRLSVRGFPASDYLLTNGVSVIPSAPMAALFYALVDGIGALKPHDIKHLLNAIARREGVPTETRRRWNLHAVSSTTEDYGRPSRKERQDDRLTFLRIQQGRKAAMLAATGIRVATEQSPYLTAREALNRDRALAVDLAAVYRSHGRLDEMDAQLAAVRRVDERLALLLTGQAA